MPSPTFTIITPSFNQAEYLEETIQSVLNQNYPHLEYIIIDGGSTDGSVDIIKKYEKHLAYWVSEKDSGQSEAINKGLKKATGDIVAWLNSDDVYCASTLTTISNLFLSQHPVSLVYGDVINFSGTSEAYYHVKEFHPYDFISRNSIHQPSVFFRRKIVLEMGGLDESLHYCMDYDLWMKFFWRYPTFKINTPLSKFRIHPNSKTSSNPKELYLEYRKIISRFMNSLSQEDIIQALIQWGIYTNPDNWKYSVAPLNCSVNKLIKIYLHECAVQEYSWGNIKQANRLFMHSLYEPALSTNLLFLLKNNLRIKK